MKNLVVLILISFLFIGCLVKEEGYLSTTNMLDNIKISSKRQVVSVSAPNNISIPFTGKVIDHLDRIVLIRDIPDQMKEMVHIKHSSETYLFDSNKYFNKENLDSFEKEINENNNIIEYTKRYGKRYNRAFVDYIDGIKCRTLEWNEFDDIYHTTSGKNTKTIKLFETYCSFYSFELIDNSYEHFLHLSYSYSYNPESSIFKNKDKTKEQILKNIQNQFNQDISEIFNSIKINSMDREKMKKEGLLYDRKYEIRN
ncbi:hypothetical protein [Aliarcobacter lanthieri]|uniref:hypothetical protein n=1 Tax=Aliarcobacter lanthieri TaxID=1355374 RepID=UPI00047D4E6C|nr:hypothetical protein [Aliarcobacter lanthieri]QKF58814.1 hypothetical protein ALANTH_0692 [Aliarcobacter lanthieri]